VAEVPLFHHAQGQTEGSTPLPSSSGGPGTPLQLGFGEVMARGRRAAEELPEGLVYAGFSLGVASAQMLVQSRPGARGALLMYSCVPLAEFGTAWPPEVPVQIHGMDADPYFVGEGDVEAAREIVASAPRAELFLHPGDQHYLADSSLPSFDADAAALFLSRVLEFLSEA
jgi:dienelactone hydrolase